MTDHDSYCRECGGAFQKSFATERTSSIEPDPDDPDVEKPWYRCHECGYTRSIDDWSEWSYCPNCGARVVDE